MRNLFLPILLLWMLLAACTTTQKGAPPRDEAKTHYLLGAAALTENNPTKALQEFLLAEKFNSRDPEVQSGLARAYLLKGAYPLAEKHYKNALDMSDNAPQYYNDLGALYLTMERYDDAIATFRKALENLLFDKPEIAWTGIGYAYLQKHDLTAAERSYKKAHEVNPRYAQAMFRLGELYYNQGRTAEAIDAFEKVVSLAPRRADGYYWLGLAAMKANDNAKARKAFMDTIRLAPDSDQARLAKNHLKTLN